VAKEALEYIRKLYENILKWYDDAEKRAQAVLTVDGVFLSVITGVLIAKSDDVGNVKDVFGLETWAFLIVTAVGLILSIGAAVLVLQARPLTKKQVATELSGVNKEEAETYNAKVMWYFQLIAELKSPAFDKKTKSIDDSEFERAALANQAFVLSRRLTHKFRLLFWSYTGTAVALAGLLAFATSYLIRV
jgi:hypothetical protein